MSTLSHPRKRYTRAQVPTSEDNTATYGSNSVAALTTAQDEAGSRTNDEYTADYINQLVNIDNEDDDDDDDDDDDSHHVEVAVIIMTEVNMYYGGNPYDIRV